MSAIKGLGAYKARKDEAAARKEAAESGRFNRFALQNDGDEVIVRFAQEVDFDARHYDEAQGIGFVNLEHNHPDPQNGWKNRANCSTDSQGECFPCNKIADRTVEWNDRKGWKQKEKFYINVIGGEPQVVKVNNKDKKFTTSVDTNTGDGEVYLLEQSTANGIWDTLSDMALDDETILENFWKIKRKGSGFNDTSYILTKKGSIPDDAKALGDFELVNIEEDATREIPFAQQESFYYKGLGAVETDKTDEASAPAAKAATAAASDEW